MKVITADIPQETYDFLNKYGTNGLVLHGTILADWWNAPYKGVK